MCGLPGRCSFRPMSAAAHSRQARERPRAVLGNSDWAQFARSIAIHGRNLHKGLGGSTSQHGAPREVDCVTTRLLAHHQRAVVKLHQKKEWIEDSEVVPNAEHDWPNLAFFSCYSEETHVRRKRTLCIATSSSPTAADGGLRTLSCKKSRSCLAPVERSPEHMLELARQMGVCSTTKHTTTSSTCLSDFGHTRHENTVGALLCSVVTPSKGRRNPWRQGRYHAIPLRRAAP